MNIVIVCYLSVDVEVVEGEQRGRGLGRHGEGTWGHSQPYSHSLDHPRVGRILTSLVIVKLEHEPHWVVEF